MTNNINNSITNKADLSGNLAIDASSLNNLKQAARENSPEAIKGVAKQFEAIFMNMMLKSMRDATPQDGLLDNDQSRTFISMLDQQLTSNLSSKGLGLADVLARQLSKNGYATNNALEQAVDNSTGLTDRQSGLNEGLINNPFLHQAQIALQQNPSRLNHSMKDSNEFKPLNDDSSADSFQRKMAQHADVASRATGIPANLMLGQAALESGWGKREIRGADGTASNNLFGIKATGNWNGKVVEAVTSEYVNGIKQKRIEKFRAYDNYADSFKDFANLMRNTPRYENVMANLDNVQGYAKAMQKAGYATDPNYAEKLTNVIKKVSSS
ncbi:flagellar assembly peptidoglycan hydrolase FlgJ [Methylotenera mobilis]|uniref:Peptidoglycan hydrolase FlgJ n=1 Tax=Methylotenera mobilis (strain JLW8 / ATCC BAA-1282 / DSM 17540) TaxID=583345 RepID=C6WVA2_METML|nr:flagellar assembly peptidoglycan hydrolase FlgJ [Methylotenera mobilis]ACT47851.1 flagellar rod assembly protein/muramidase FlgJ [Methylotenera mobilis JLW8]